MTVEFNSPPRHFFDEPMSVELDALTRALDRDPSIGAVVFTGAGDSYLTHFDVPTLLRGASIVPFTLGYRQALLVGSVSRALGRNRLLDRVARHTPARDMAFLGRIYGALDRLNRSDKVVVTAINGLAIGMGCIFALACDIRLIADDSRIGLPESALGIVAAAGGTHHLIRAVGASRALELLLDGTCLTATEAHELGIVHQVVSRQDLRARATEVAERLARRPPAVTREIKRLAYAAGPRRAALRREAASALATLTTAPARHRLDQYRHHLAAQTELTDDVILAGWRPLLDGAASISRSD